MSTTTNLADFGYRELELLKNLIQAKMDQGFPEDFSLRGVTVMMNQNSGNVFFTNDEYQVAMVNGDTLEMFHTCGECGQEGFASEFRLTDTGCQVCSQPSIEEEEA